MRAEGNERIMKLSVIEKKRLRIYLLIAYGVTFLMGRLCGMDTPRRKN